MSYKDRIRSGFITCDNLGGQAGGVELSLVDAFDINCKFDGDAITDIEIRALTKDWEKESFPFIVASGFKNIEDAQTALNEILEAIEEMRNIP